MGSGSGQKEPGPLFYIFYYSIRKYKMEWGQIKILGFRKPHMFQ